MGMLFPRAIRVLGWRHQFDLVTRKGLSGLEWFPKFLKQLKSLTYFVRDSNLNQDLCKRQRRNGLVGAADLLSAAMVPNFAKWRWNTLNLACASLSGFIATLAANFRHPWFENMRQTHILKDVVAALSSALWMQRFRYVAWFSAWIAGIQNWAGYDVSPS